MEYSRRSEGYTWQDPSEIKQNLYLYPNIVHLNLPMVVFEINKKKNNNIGHFMCITLLKIFLVIHKDTHWWDPWMIHEKKRFPNSLHTKSIPKDIKGLNSDMVWLWRFFTRKTDLHFCFIIFGKLIVMIKQSKQAGAELGQAQPQLC